jgi:hypothetical protein
MFLAGIPLSASRRSAVQPPDPYTGTDLLQALSSVEADVAAFFGSLSDDEFRLRVDDAWTPAEHLEHLNVSVGAVARGLAIPRWLLLLRFGPARRPSRRYTAIRETYRATLAAGGRASGIYVPPRQALAATDVGGRRTEILARWGRVNARLRTALASWGETGLERIRLPHPLLGKLTTREMLLFTLYHNQHHVAAAARRLPRLNPAP